MKRNHIVTIQHCYHVPLQKISKKSVSVAQDVHRPVTLQDFQGDLRVHRAREPPGAQTCPDCIKPLAPYHHLTCLCWAAAAPALFAHTDPTQVHKNYDSSNVKGFSAQHWIE